MSKEVGTRAHEEAKATIGDCEPAIELVIRGISKPVPAPEEVEEGENRNAYENGNIIASDERDSRRQRCYLVDCGINLPVLLACCIRPACRKRM